MSRWTSIKEELPECPHEAQEDFISNERFEFDGHISQSVEITDGYNYARGHYRDDGRWNIYGAEHDFQIVDEGEITHWMPLPKLPRVRS